jgi:hypothetical protein
MNQARNHPGNHPRVGERLRGLAVGVLCAALLLGVVGWKGLNRKGQALLQEFTSMLGGSYDNLAQSRLPGGEHVPLKLYVVPVDAPLVGDYVYYVQEMAADDPRRVFAQRLYSVVESADPLHPVLAQYDFTSPARWRNAQARTELFRGLIHDDLRLRSGCEMRIERKEQGFVLQNDPKSCRVPARGTGETLRAEQKMELDEDGLRMLDIRRDVNGTVMEGGGDDPWYRFIRRADAPW